MIKYDVFISYSRKDKKAVMDFCEELSKASISYWLDNQGISNGEEFKSVIVKAIEESAVFIFISSKSSMFPPIPVSLHPEQVNVSITIKNKILYIFI